LNAPESVGMMDIKVLRLKSMIGRGFIVNYSRREVTRKVTANGGYYLDALSSRDFICHQETQKFIS
jgi:hypothetical protein